MRELDLALVGSAAAVLSAVATTLGIGFLIWQIRLARRVASADFLLRLERDFAGYVDTYQKLRPHGPWAPHATGPADEADVVKLVTYLNFFGSLHIMVARGFLDLDTIDKMFAYRFFIAMHNPHTLERVIGPDRAYWGQVLDLYREWMALRHGRGTETPQDEYAPLVQRVADDQEPEPREGVRRCQPGF